MRKILAISFLCIHLTGNTEAGQLLKLPKLLSHFFQHHQLDPSISFIDFIKMHYGGDDGTKADDDFDNQLPCHSSGQNTISIVYSPMVKEIPPIEFSFFQTQVYSSRLQTGPLPEHVQVILQPPRFA